MQCEARKFNQLEGIQKRCEPVQNCNKEKKTTQDQRKQLQQIEGKWN